MSTSTSITLFVFIASLTTALTMTSKFFKVVTSSAGVELCAIDNPAEVLWLLVDMATQCALRCVSELFCIAFNFNAMTGKCDLYSCLYPSNYSVIPGCKSYVAKDKPYLPTDCNDVMLMSSTAASGVYTIWISGNLPVQVYCYFSTGSGGWTVIQRRRNGGETFNRNWTDFARGFGQLNGEFWLGNENIHLMTSSKRYQLRVSLTDWEGNNAYEDFANFVVGNASDKFKLVSLGSFSGNAGNAMSYHVGMKFSTFDQDNDNSSQISCAAFCSGGWWYANCGGALLNSIYRNSSATTNWNGLLWITWHGSNYSMKATEMKIKPF